MNPWNYYQQIQYISSKYIEFTPQLEQTLLTNSAK